MCIPDRETANRETMCKFNEVGTEPEKPKQCSCTTAQKTSMLPKIFYGTLCVGVLFSLVLLILFLVQPGVNAGADAVPKENAAEGWVVILFFLFFQVFSCVFSLLFPLCINHAYRAEVWKNKGFFNTVPLFKAFFPLPYAMQNEEKMRKVRETVLSAFWLMGTVGTLPLIAIQWLFAAEQGILPALFSKFVGVGLLIIGFIGFIVCFGIMFVKMCVVLGDFLRPDK